MISVIVPVYNVENYIERCVNSIQAQTYGEFELILVDDGSTDGSGRICDRMKEEDRRIQVIHQENKGLSAARNRGLSAATGDYITYIDSDDYVHPSYLEVLYHNAVSYQADVSVCGLQLVWGNNRVKPKRNKNAVNHIAAYSGRQAAKEIVAGNKRNMIIACGKLYSQRLKELLDYPEGRLHEDEFVTYKVFYEAERVVVTEHPLYFYYQREKSITNSGFSKRRLDKLVALNEAIEYFERRKDRELMSYAIKRYLLNLQIAWYRVEKYLPEEKMLLRILHQKWKEVYSSGKAAIAGICSPVDRSALLIFNISPDVYRIMAGLVERILPIV